MSDTEATTEPHMPLDEEATANEHAARSPDAAPRRRPWLWLFAGIVVSAAAGAAVLIALDGGGPDSTAAPTSPARLAEAVITDLVQIESYEGTLGTVDGDPVTTQLSGTLTTAAGAGEMVGQGDVLFSIDGEPVILLYGESPAYRDMAAGAETLAVQGRLVGTITAAAEPGAPLAQGDVLYRVDGEPVVVLYGDVPAYRTLFDAPTNLQGEDVEQLEAALVALGYDPDEAVTVDREFTSSTAQMVEAWQEDVGAETDGIVHHGEVIFIPGPAQVRTIAAVGDSTGGGAPVASLITGEPMVGRDVEQLEAALAALGFDPGEIDGTFTDETRAAVSSWQASTGLEQDGVVDLGEVVFLETSVLVSDGLSSVGSRVGPGSPVLAVSSSDKVVRVNLPARDQGVVSVGDDVIVVLPDFSETPGVVVSVATTATVDQGNQAVFEVIVELLDPSVAGSLDEAPVDVDVISDSVEGVLAVPVSALVALSEGGYAVRVDNGGGSSRLVAVDPGFFADGLVEIAGDGLKAGDRVVVP